MVEKIADAIDGKGAVRLWRTLMMLGVLGLSTLVWDVRDRVSDLSVLEQRQSSIEQRQDRQEARVGTLEDWVYRYTGPNR